MSYHLPAAPPECNGDGWRVGAWRPSTAGHPTRKSAAVKVGAPARLLGVRVNRIKAASSLYAHMSRHVCILCEDRACLGEAEFSFEGTQT